MEATPLMKLKSHIDGKNADVEIYPDRIEWARAGDVSKTKMMAGIATMGLSLAATGTRKGGGTEMIPIKAMSSVTTAKDGMRYYKLVVIASGNTVEFRVDKGDAEQAKVLLTQLIVGSHPSQQAAASPAPAQPAPPVPGPASTTTTLSAPPPPPTPAADSVATGKSIGEQLREMAALRDDGLITEEDYQAAKVRLLG